MFRYGETVVLDGYEPVTIVRYGHYESLVRRLTGMGYYSIIVRTDRLTITTTIPYTVALDRTSKVA